MKILVINGSPKRDKSDVMHITRAFLEGMQQAGEHQIQVIHAVEQNVKYCTGCFSCMNNGGHCIHDDDMRGILEDILQSDLLLFRFPLYCYGMPTPLKAIIDRVLPLSKMTMEKVGDRYQHVGQGDYSHLKYLMICGCGFPNSQQNFEPAVSQFKLLFPHDHTIVTVPESPMFNVPQADVVTVPRLARVREAGLQYAQSGRIDDELLADICSPMIPEAQYAAIVNGEA